LSLSFVSSYPIADKDDKKLTIDQITRMKYLPQVIQETLRLYATVPYTTRTATSTIQIKDGGTNVVIPQGTNILIPFFLLNRDAELWTAPTKFDPDRFHGQPTSFQSSKVGYYPFGCGGNQCVGSLLAQIEISIMMIYLLKRYVLHPEPEFKVGLKTGLSLSPSNGVKIKIEKIPVL
jgi:cytochrome P450